MRIKHLLLSFLIIFLSYNVQAQSLKGSIKDSLDKKNLQQSVVSILREKDSVLVKFTRVNKDGDFQLSAVKEDKYILMITHPLMGDYFDQFEMKQNQQLDLGTVYLTPKSKLLAEVILKSGSAIKIKGDTTIYTADSFSVSANANVEELLRKLPGIQVDKNGQIKAMGQNVERVLVDGEEFFGDDPGMAVKNLRADAVKEVQVFDKKSEQAEFTGIDDGKTQKTINLKLKEDKKKGHFGKIDIAGGLKKNIDDRFNNNLMFSSFKGKRKLSAFLLNGNTGQDGLGWQDNEKFGGDNDNMSMSMDDDGGVMMMWRGGGTDDEPYVNTQNGYITNVNAGLHYSNKWNDKKTFTFSPKFNSQLYTNPETNFTQTQIGDSIINDNANSTSYVNRRNFKNSATYDLKIDSVNSLKITAKANFYHTENEDVRNSISTGNTGTLKNTSFRNNKNTIDKEAYTLSAIYKHKFKKDRRTMTINADWNLLDQKTDGILQSNNQSFFNGFPSFTQNLNQSRDGAKKSQKLTSKITYTEPLSIKYSLELGYEFILNNAKNDQVTYSYTPSSGKYDLLVDSLSNEFDQNIYINKPSFRINYSNKKIKYNFGSGFGITRFNLSDITLNKDYLRNFVNFFPSATFTYNYKVNSSLRMSYNGNTTQPTINQIQPLRNNNDFFNQYIGNPNLKPSFNNSINLSHNSYNFLKERWMYQSVWMNVNSNAITNGRIINLDSGKTVSQPINVDGNYTIGMWSTFGFKLKKMKLNLNFSPVLNFNRTIDVVNNVQNKTNTFSPGLEVSINKSKDKKYDLGISNNFNYNSNKSTQYTNQLNFYTNNLRVDATVYLKKVWMLGTEYNFYNRQKTPQFNTNLNNHILNAQLRRNFKKDEFTFYFIVRDILNQNTGIERRFYSNTLTETTNDRLRRYWMLGFAWNFKNKAAAAPSKTP